jgi:sugar (pentulose or hexulose) kinase
LHTTRWGTLGAYFHELLCNRFAESAAALPLLLPVDRWRPAWSSDRAAWRAVGLDPTAVPEAIPAGSLVGPLSGSGAKRTGLSPGVPVVATGGDKNCEILGGAARGPVEGVLSLGTALSLGTMVDDLDVYRRNPSLWCTAAPTADRWTVEAGVPGGLWTLEWLAGLLSSSLKRLERIAQCVPPGSEGVTLVPHFSGSVSQPGARGVVSGLTPQHGPGHLYRAALEGLAFEARRCREEIETTSGCVMNTIRLAGGGSRSPLFRGILAAVVGRKLLVPKQPAGGARGAAVMASLLIRPGRLEARVRKFMGDYERVSSSSALRRTYESLYESQYLEVRPTSTIHLDSA